MEGLGFWIFMSIVALCVTCYKLTELRHQYETRDQTREDK